MARISLILLLDTAYLPLISSGSIAMISFYVVLSIVSGFSVGVSYSVRLMIPSVLGLVALVAIAQPALVADQPILVADATVLVALQEIAALIGLGLRLAINDRRAAQAERRQASSGTAAASIEAPAEIIVPLAPTPRVWGSARRTSMAVAPSRRRRATSPVNAQMARTYESFTIF